MTDSGSGIQELMAAETRASQIVAEARIGTYVFLCAVRSLAKESRLFYSAPFL